MGDDLPALAAGAWGGGIFVLVFVCFHIVAADVDVVFGKN